MEYLSIFVLVKRLGQHLRLNPVSQPIPEHMPSVPAVLPC